MYNIYNNFQKIYKDYFHSVDCYWIIREFFSFLFFLYVYFFYKSVYVLTDLLVNKAFYMEVFCDS